jgi:hypothetical protein
MLNLGLLLSSSSILDGDELGLEHDICILDIHKLHLELGKLGLHVGQKVMICCGCLSNAILLGLTLCDGQNLGGLLVEMVSFFVSVQIIGWFIVGERILGGLDKSWLEDFVEWSNLEVCQLKIA